MAIEILIKLSVETRDEARARSVVALALDTGAVQDAICAAGEAVDGALLNITDAAIDGGAPVASSPARAPSTLPLAKLRKLAAQLARKTRDAYSADLYGAPAWRASCLLLPKRGYSIVETEVVMRSKVPRWVRDERSGARVIAADLTRWIDAAHNAVLIEDILREVLAAPGDCADCGKPIKGAPIKLMGTSARCGECHAKRGREGAVRS